MRKGAGLGKVLTLANTIVEHAWRRRPKVNEGCCRRLIHVHGRLYLTLYEEEEEAGKVAQHETSNFVVTM
jgi:hypothetical protein